MTGLRQGELLALRWLDVDLSAGRLRVRRSYTRYRFGTPKSLRSTRSVPMSARVRRELLAHHRRTLLSEGEDLVFCHPVTGSALDPTKVRRRFRAALRRAGVREVRFHDLRDTFGTHCAAAGVPLRTLQEWMGHRDAKTTAIYADYARARTRLALSIARFPPNVSRYRSDGMVAEGAALARGQGVRRSPRAG